MQKALILPPAAGSDDILLPGRRRVIQAAAAALTTVSLPGIAQVANFWDTPRELWLRRPDTREEVRAVYWANGRLVPEGYSAICQLLRDIHIGRAVQFDLTTLDIARGIYGWLLSANVPRPLIINSGYRHPRTNATEGGVKNSLHIQAKAIDLRIEGVSADSVARFGRYLSGGGVGFYPGKNFIHVDAGKVRFWRG